MAIKLTNQIYSLIYWADEDRNPIEIWTKVNAFIGQYGNEYLFRIRDGQELDTSYDGLVEIYRIKKASMKNPQKAMKMSVWSSNSLWFSLSTGVVAQFANSSINLPDVLMFQFDLAHIQGGSRTILSFHQLKELFRYGLIIFKPYYSRLHKSGEVNYHGSSYEEIGDQIDTSKIPIAIEWFNYFSPSWVDRFGGEQFVLSAPVLHAEKVEETGGVILILQEEPFDFMNDAHMSKRKQVEDYLRLPSLHKQFQK